MAATKPDMIIAVDFGMTCTGVAYANPSVGSDTIRWIQRWPGRMDANENKVPTIVVYPKNEFRPSSWGFLSETKTEQSAENKNHKEWFKTLLDEDKLRQAQMEAGPESDVPRSMADVEKSCLDYFGFLYQYIEAKLQQELPSSWADARIEFIFSVPTTWRPHPTVERFRSLAQRAGFGRCSNHTLSIGLTEAEAAAVHTSRELPAIFKERDILLVCDAGGGTTDLSALRVTGTEAGGAISLEQLDVVFGANLGSAQIDAAFEKSVQYRLEMSSRTFSMNIDPGDAAWEMMKSREYQNAKCDYGSMDDTDSFTVAIPRLDKNYQNKSMGIDNGEMWFSRMELQGLFDVQINKLFGLVDRQLQQMLQKFPGEQIAHLVLSGGLGNSAYVQRRLRSRYASGASSFQNAANVQVRVAPDPQLVVCKGIVADRLQKVRKGVSVMPWRCCRSSYGTICKELYDQAKPAHFGRATMVDPIDKKIYVVDVVEWFIKKGQPVSTDYPIVRNFRQKVKKATPHRVFPTAVIESHLDSENLPYTKNQYCNVLCNITSDFSKVELALFKLKNRHWWNSGEKYYRVEYLIKVVLGAADINFELWLNGIRLSDSHSISVDWQVAEAPPPMSPHGPPVGVPHNFRASNVPEWSPQRPFSQSNHNLASNGRALY